MPSIVYNQFEDIISSIKESHKLLTILDSGRYRGFDTLTQDTSGQQVPGYIKVKIGHLSTGIRPSFNNTPNELSDTYYGALVTPHGAIIHETGELGFSIPHNLGPSDSFYYIKCTFNWEDTPGGISPIYSMDVSPAINPINQVLIGKIKAIEGAVTINGLTFYPSQPPSFAGTNELFVKSFGASGSATYDIPTQVITLPTKGNKFAITLNSTGYANGIIRGISCGNFIGGRLYHLLLSTTNPSGLIELVSYLNGGQFLNNADYVGDNGNIILKSPALVTIMKDGDTDFIITLSDNYSLRSDIISEFGQSWVEPGIQAVCTISTSFIASHPQSPFAVKYSVSGKCLKFRGGLTVANTIAVGDHVMTLPSTLPAPVTDKYFNVRLYQSEANPGSGPSADILMYLTTDRKVYVGAIMAATTELAAITGYKKLNFDPIIISLD